MDGEQRRGRQELGWRDVERGFGDGLGTRARCLAVLGLRALAICGARMRLEPLLDSVPAHTSTHRSFRWTSERATRLSASQGASIVTAQPRDARRQVASCPRLSPARKISRDDRMPQGTVQGIVYSGGHREEYS